MRRCLSFLACLLLLFPCVTAFTETEAPPAFNSVRSYKENGESYQYIALGKYHISIQDPGDSPRKTAWKWSRHRLQAVSSMLKDEPIIWRVLDVDENNVAYLCSEYVLFAMPMHNHITNYKTLGKDFANTDLSAYLNSEFFDNVFPAYMRDCLFPVRDEKNRISLLSKADLNNRDYGFGTKKSRMAWGTEYAIRHTNLFVYRVAVGQHSPYWVVDQAASDKRHGCSTKQNGAVGHIVCNRDNIGVRPTIKLDLNNVFIYAGDGTLESPFKVEHVGHYEIIYADNNN